MCTLLLCCGADPTLVNCHTKTALDLAPNEELRQRIECKMADILAISGSLNHYVLAFPDEYKGHLLLEHALRGDVSKMKKLLSSKLATFQHPQTLDSPMVNDFMCEALDLCHSFHFYCLYHPLISIGL